MTRLSFLTRKSPCFQMMKAGGLKLSKKGEAL